VQRGRVISTVAVPCLFVLGAAAAFPSLATAATAGVVPSHTSGCPAWFVAATAPPTARTTPAPATGSPTATITSVAGSTLVSPTGAQLSAALTGAGDGVSVVGEYWRLGATNGACTTPQHTEAAKLDVHFSQLAPATRYRFRFAVKRGNDTELSALGTFSTLPSGTIPQGVTVGSTSIGRMRKEGALSQLTKDAAAPVRFTYAGAYWRVAPGKLGLLTNAEPTLTMALNASPGVQLPPVKTTVDVPKLNAYIASLTKKWNRKAAAADVRLVGKHAVVTEAAKGVSVNEAALAKEVTQELESGSRKVITLPVVATHVAATTPEKAVVVRLSTQTLTAYLNGKPVLKTPVTTGRPALPTPIGSFSVQFRASPYVFHSPWPEGSPYYYPPTPVTWAMEFYDGDFLHDDPAEPASDFGSDSQNGYFASHGCVHVPHDAMAYLYNWLPVGAPVIVSFN
jgi:lipoprotein-anchoring transpeptidase ErfK/SrfK